MKITINLNLNPILLAIFLIYFLFSAVSAILEIDYAVDTIRVTQLNPENIGNGTPVNVKSDFNFSADKGLILRGGNITALDDLCIGAC